MPTVPSSAAYVDFRRRSEVWYLPIWRDKNGDVIQNTAKGPLPKPQIEPVAIGILKATVRKTSFTDTDYKTQLNALNDDTWRAYTAGQAWIAGLWTDEVNEGGVDYTLAHYTVLGNEYGWQCTFPDIGYYYLSSGNPLVFADSAGNPYIGCLNAGAKLSSASDMVLTDWDIKREIDFSALGF